MAKSDTFIGMVVARHFGVDLLPGKRFVSTFACLAPHVGQEHVVALEDSSLAQNGISSMAVEATYATDSNWHGSSIIIM